MTQTPPERIWLAPDEMSMANDWGAVRQDKGISLYWEGDSQHHPDDDEVPYIRADVAQSRLDAATKPDDTRIMEVTERVLHDMGETQPAMSKLHHRQFLKAALSALGGD